ncbi:hypothetical protein [Sphaerisporangium sp. TRM90804]|uniref:hypothetical protein n=1 Tax=Sphaerisporangium sp. TRM90804 TaxID=3031113 RepID=UPI00244C6527|nr:hypothetical protein [Sphaerisporangium sp. TRM90804]MDH2427013.1 hypothetical protein [Sphaerisporangium sp. TRM90804]
MAGGTTLGGTGEPEVARHRDGPADAASVLVVVDPGPDKPRSAQASRERDHLAYRAPPRRPLVTVNGRLYELPHDDEAALLDFLTMAYLVYGWGPIVAVGRELAQMRLLKLHPGRGAASPLSLRIVDVGLTEISQWILAYEKAALEFRLEVLRKARSLEDTARDIVLTMLRRSAGRVVDEAMRYFQWKSRDGAVAALQALPAAEIQEDEEAVRDLRDRLERLAPSARTVQELNREAQEEEAGQRRSLGRDQVGIVSPTRVAKLEKTREAGRRARDAYVKALFDEAAGAAVLFRFDLESVVTAVDKPAELSGLVFTRLQGTWNATQRLYEPLRARRPARVVGEQDVRGGGLPERLIAAKIGDSVWTHRKVVAAALDRLPVIDRDLYERMLDNLAAAQADEEIAGTRLGVLRDLGLGALTIALTVVCPPAGIALDVGLSVGDVVSTVAEYLETAAESLSDLDPRECLADVEPSAVPIILSVAGALLSVG